MSKVVPGGLADKKKVVVGWRCFDVAGTAVDSSKEAMDALGVARKGGKPFVISFLAPAAAKSSAAAPATSSASASKSAPATSAAKAAAPPSPEEVAAAEAKAAEEAAAAEATAAEEARKVAEEAAAAEEARLAAEAEAARRKEMGNGKVVIKYNMYARRADGSRRRRGRDADIPLVAAPPRPGRGYSAETGYRYAEEFEIKDGSTTAAAIDDEYGLTFVMPKCTDRVASTRFLREDDASIPTLQKLS